jgi:hypothetical protein
VAELAGAKEEVRMCIKLADAEGRKIGWTYEFYDLQQTQKGIENMTGERLELEGIESVLRFIDYATLTAELTAAKEENTALRERVKELTQCDPSWYDASPADAFMLLKKAQERVKVLEAVLAEAVNYLRSSHHHPAARTFEAALKEGE